MATDALVHVATDRFADDLDALTNQLGFRVDVIFPADSPANAIVSGHGLRLRLEQADETSPVTIELLTDEPGDPVVLPGGTTVRCRARTRPSVLPANRPSLTIVSGEGSSGVGRAGMRYRDLLPDRWGGRFISSHITIPDGGPVPDYVHFHKIRFQLIFVKAGWVRVVYEDQGEPFVMEAGDCVLQPPEIRHRVLESSPGAQVVEIGCPAEHETIADWATVLPTAHQRPDRDFAGQRFVRNRAAEASYSPWRCPGWRHRDTGVGDATDGLAGARVASPDGVPDGCDWIEHDTEFTHLVMLSGEVTIDTPEGEPVRLTGGAAVTMPGKRWYRLLEPTDDCELLDVTLPASFDTLRHPV